MNKRNAILLHHNEDLEMYKGLKVIPDDVVRQIRKRKDRVS